MIKRNDFASNNPRLSVLIGKRCCMERLRMDKKRINICSPVGYERFPRYLSFDLKSDLFINN